MVCLHCDLSLVAYNTVNTSMDIRWMDIRLQSQEKWVAGCHIMVMRQVGGYQVTIMRNVGDWVPYYSSGTSG